MNNDTTTTAPGEPRKRRRRGPLPESEFILRDELLALVPLARSTIDDLEKRGVFPRRVQMLPTRRVAWKRREVMKFLKEQFKPRDEAAT